MVAQDATTPPAARAQAELARLLDGYLTTQLIYVAARLGLADALTDGPQTATTLAAAIGAAPNPLARALRGLALAGIVAEEADGRWALTPLGELLRADAPGSLRGAALARGELYYGAAAGLLETIRAGGIAFEQVHGARFFDYLARDPAREAAFQASMADRGREEAAAAVAAYDFSGIRRIVDIGGGSGILLAAILRATPDLRGTLLDRPVAAAQARERLAAGDLAGRAEVIAGDFFDTVPTGADAYLLSRILHDWEDEAARAILRVCRRAMPPGACLLLIEAVMPARAGDAPGVVRMDLHMLTLFGGRERTAAEYRALLASVGLTLGRIVPTGSPSGICIIEAALADD